ncbi:MAG: hypothetical protein GYB67_17030 [Chloroflexi bacterium]|nr:hypothetical protein [Chloroflexota bacterium]
MAGCRRESPLVRPLLRLALLLTGLHAGALLAIRLHPPDSASLRDFLLPPGCVAPCVLGIQPGRTDVETAMRRLQAHGWVQTVTRSSDPHSGSVFIEFTWSGAMPWAESGATGTVGFDTAGRVTLVYFATTIPFGDVWLVLGEPPPRTDFADGIDRILYRNQAIITRDAGVYIRAAGTAWDAPTAVYLRAIPTDSDPPLLRVQATAAPATNQPMPDGPPPPRSQPTPSRALDNQRID